MLYYPRIDRIQATPPTSAPATPAPQPVFRLLTMFDLSEIRVAVRSQQNNSRRQKCDLYLASEQLPNRQSQDSTLPITSKIDQYICNTTSSARFDISVVGEKLEHRYPEFY
ncbi:MAG: hypothetical protein QNJ54_22355 [Prochloraceae cyanobacterium]|nr:hypothetical protein [Prochloraceae cyanobacterium]